MQASASRNIQFISKGGTYTSQIMSPQGDLYQEYTEESDGSLIVSPDFSVTRPVLYFACSSSRASEGIVVPKKMRYFFNGEEIMFNGEISVGKFEGCFVIVRPTKESKLYGLQVVKNIVSLSEKSNANIRMEAEVEVGVFSDIVQSTYTIVVRSKTEDYSHVTIFAGDNNNFIIREKGGSCILSARVFNGSTESVGTYYYRWQSMQSTGWQNIPSERDSSIVVMETDINTYGDYRVLVYKDADMRILVGFDEQNVMDATDPYEILANPNPMNEVISDDEYGNSSVTYTPSLVRRGTVDSVLGARFRFIVRDSVGNILNADHGTLKESETVTLAQCIAADGDLTVTIFSN